MELDLTDAALADLRSIRAYTLETWGEKQEDKYLNEFRSQKDEIWKVATKESPVSGSESVGLYAGMGGDEEIGNHLFARTFVFSIGQLDLPCEKRTGRSKRAPLDAD